MAATVNYYPEIEGGGAISLFHEEASALANSLATFTGTRYMAAGQYPNSIAVGSRTLNPTTGSGSGTTATAGVIAFTNNFIQTPKTLPWFVAFNARVTGAFAGVQHALFDTHDGTTDFVRFGYQGGLSNSFWAVDVGHSGSTTSANSTIALDNLRHMHAVYYDGSTALTYYVDGVLAATINVLTNFPTTPQSICAQAGTNVAIVYEIFYAFNETA